MRAVTFSFLLPVLAIATEPYEPKPGSPDRPAIMEAMRGPVSKYIGKRVTFTGSVKIVDGWATFEGNVAPSDGKPAQGGNAYDLDLDFFALLRQENKTWKLLHWGFAGDIGVAEEARKKYPQSPKSLFSFLNPQ